MRSAEARHCCKALLTLPIVLIGLNIQATIAM